MSVSLPAAIFHR